MLNLFVAQGDKGYGVAFTVYTSEAHTQVKNLTGYTARLKAWVPNRMTPLVIDEACALAADPTTGVCTWVVMAANTANAGTYYAEIELLKSGVQESTGTFLLVVLPSP